MYLFIVYFNDSFIFISIVFNYFIFPAVFLTGTDRIPLGGFRRMKIYIQRMDGGTRCERLPVAHTCFNIMDLPPYPSKQMMRDKLLQAINFTSGFGLV